MILMNKYTYYNRHYYNNIVFTPWPFFISISLFILIFIFLLMLNKIYIIHIYLTIAMLVGYTGLLFYGIFGWIKELVYESFFGKYTKKLKAALVFGFFLFLLSEIMLFGSFFWVYFDRIFHLSYITGFLSIPSTVELIRWFKEPLYATIILIFSGFTCNYSYYLHKTNIYLKDNLEEAFFFSFITNILGTIFLYIQYLEYTHLSFTISDTVYCSIFYVLTGFHGLHVLIGNIFLLIQYLIKLLLRDNRLLGLSLAVIYWHFVDIIWIFLFFFLYFFNNFDYMLIKEYNSYYYNELNLK